VAGQALRRLFAIGVFYASCGAFALPMLAQTKEPAVKRAALLKMAEPWPDAETMTARRIEAENRRLFAGAEPFPLTLSADFKTINKDRATEGKKPYPAELTITDDSGKPTTFHVTLRTRGHFRLRASSCSFVPLRVEFKSEETAGTLFDHQKNLKLITHCQNDKEYDQYTLREYLVYRASNLMTPRSFRARLTKASYVQSTDGKPVTSRYGMFLEDDDDVARRMEGRIMELPRAAFKDVDADALALAMMFEYMIGNTDFSMYMLHNIRLVRTPTNQTYTVPYDFDLSGLVNTQYAIPEKSFGLKSVRERLYRGPCRPAEEVEPVLQMFRAKKAEILGLYDSLPDLDRAYQREAKEYLEEFFRGIDRQGDVKSAFVDGRCNKKPTM
jgi:hypothetical protein